MKHPEWRELDPWRRQSVEKLAAILRIADGLDRGHRQAVASVACRVRQKRVVFEVAAREDLARTPDEIAPELESARRKAKLFFRVFGRRAVFKVEEAAASPRLRTSKGTAA